MYPSLEEVPCLIYHSLPCEEEKIMYFVEEIQCIWFFSHNDFDLTHLFVVFTLL